MSNAIRGSTANKYEIYQKKFVSYCIVNSINMSEVNIINVLNFLNKLFKTGNSYSLIKSAKAAINHIVTIPSYSSILEIILQ